ncbi:plasmid stabilization protein [Geovibrio thiophilus]|uniref:Plasmid stabilization protein n=1 Tax=Geovibrio thiophilus TaxID=139438 RepID=A0A3R5V0V9_9BACT|nr:plasmid stabilization protein [Geovibrio thiophilus]QAR32866.1 plasmid stabilization protein [Geovibrio thiophilus]
MKFELIYTESYCRKAAKFLRKHPEIKELYAKTLTLLELNPSHNSLRLHKPEGKFSGLFSVSINMQYRICIEFFISDNKIIPVHIGSHDEVYK